MRCNQELYGHITCDRDVIIGEKFCKFHFAPSLRLKITELEEVLRYCESQFRYIKNVSKQEDVETCSSHTLDKILGVLNAK